MPPSGGSEAPVGLTLQRPGKRQRGHTITTETLARTGGCPRKTALNRAPNYHTLPKPLFPKHCLQSFLTEAETEA